MTTTYDMFPARGAGAKLAHPVELICFALIVANAVYLIAFYVQGSWLVGPDGSPIATDFITVWAAGRMALAGHAAYAYDWAAQKLVEESAVGHPFAGYLGWPYPPTTFFVAIAASLLPYTSAFISWISVTFVAYLAAIRAIVGDRAGYFLAAAFPAVLANAMVGQNGFLSAALIGGTLILMDPRPICAGVLLGLLTYKPHLGLLFPIALAASGRWRVFVTAGIVAGLTAAASWAVFGSAAWQAFPPGMNHVSHALLFEGLAEWGKLQTALGLTRVLGGSETLAWTVQIAAALIAATSIAVLWRSQVVYEIKAAALSTATLLMTPYLFTYDLVILAVPLAFLFRLGRANGFLKYELAGIGLACVPIVIFPFVKASVGFAAVMIAAGLVARRALAPAPRSVAP